MNLKQAARELGVHYQTAYKWVRTGVLPAVRIGAQYEISEAGIERCLAGRRQAVACADRPGTDVPSGATDPTATLDALTALTRAPVLTRSAVTATVARRVAQVTGDLVVAAAWDADGDHAAVSFDHRCPDRAALVNAATAFGRRAPRYDRWFGGATWEPGQVVMVPHVDQAVLRRRVLPQFRQYLDVAPIHRVVAVPVVDDEVRRGVVAALRDQTAGPHTPDDRGWFQELGRTVGALVATSDSVESALALRHRVDLAVRDTVGRRALDVPTAIRALASAGPDPRYRCSIVDPDGRLLAACGPDLASTAAGVEALARLRGSDLDYLDRVVGDAVHHHRSLRRDDASLIAVVTVTRPVVAVGNRSDLAGALTGR